MTNYEKVKSLEGVDNETAYKVMRGGAPPVLHWSIYSRNIVCNLEYLCQWLSRKETSTMATKDNPGRFDCYTNAKPNEPMFVLLGRDPVAWYLVLQWAELRIKLGLNRTEDDQTEDSFKTAMALKEYAAELGKDPNAVYTVTDVEKLNSLAKECHDISVSKGFYDPPPTFEQRLVLIHSEVSEALEEHRDGRAPTDERYTKSRGGEGPSKPEGIPSEFADIIIRVLDASAYYGIDIGRAVREKLEYNKTRPHKHGRFI